MKALKAYRKQSSAKSICERTRVSVDLLRAGSWLKAEDLTVFAQMVAIAAKVEKELDELIVEYNTLLLKDTHSLVAKAAGHTPKEETSDEVKP